VNLPTLDPPAVIAGAAAASAAMQWIFARRRDLGPFTLGLGGAALALGGERPEIAASCSAVAVLAAIAWLRAGKGGVGRPGLVGVALAAAVIGGLARVWVHDSRVGGAAAVGIAVIGAAPGLVALERPGPRRRAVRWVGRIPVEGPSKSP
jgi:hypothetical protein